MTNPIINPATRPSWIRSLLELDARWSAKLNLSQQHGKIRNVLRFLAHSGDSWFMIPVLVMVWWLGSEYWKQLALTLIIAILLTAVVVFLIKFTVRRRRPEGEWGKFYRSTDPHSFPSGHAVRAVMLAVVMLGLGPLWLGLILLVWAPLVGLARVAMGVHYLSDVLAGMLLGLLIGVVVLLIA